MLPSGPESDSAPPAHNQFATTQWSLVLAAGQHQHAESTRALEKLCRAYWPPLYAYVLRRVRDVHAAQDLTQAFFERLLDKQYLQAAHPDRGRFRAFLITACRNFLSKERDRQGTQKRGGRHCTFSMDFSQADALTRAADTLTAERLYERQWALTLLDRVLQRLQREQERAGHGRQFQLLKDFLAGSGSRTYASVAAELQLTESACRMAASRLRQRYRELLHDEIAQTVASVDEIQAEVQYLFQTFSS